jgi:hypothetical protein
MHDTTNLPSFSGLKVICHAYLSGRTTIASVLILFYLSRS